jgi:hypothetical protein
MASPTPRSCMTSEYVFFFRISRYVSICLSRCFFFLKTLYQRHGGTVRNQAYIFHAVQKLDGQTVTVFEVMDMLRDLKKKKLNF